MLEAGDKSDQSICVFVYICIWVNVKFVCLCIFAFVYMCICVFVLVKKYCGGAWVESFGGWRLEWPQWRNLSRECKHRLHIILRLHTCKILCLNHTVNCKRQQSKSWPSTPFGETRVWWPHLQTAPPHHIELFTISRDHRSADTLLCHVELFKCVGH